MIGRSAGIDCTTFSALDEVQQISVRALTPTVVLTYETTVWPGYFALKAAKSFSSHDSASEHPASGQGISTFLSGQSTLAVSAMKCTPANRMMSASTDCALTERASESPRKSAASCTSGVV